MAYCRFSSMGWKCDVYVYEAVTGGWTTHVAGSRHTNLEDMPEVPPLPAHILSNEDAENWAAAHRRQMDWLGNTGTEKINLPHAGETFNDPSPGACADRLESLARIGYHVPDYAIEVLREEQEFIDDDTAIPPPKTCRPVDV